MIGEDAKTPSANLVRNALCADLSSASVFVPAFLAEPLRLGQVLNAVRALLSTG